MEFKILLPKISAGVKLAGVYRILFDDGSFYIGCSADLQGRSYGWSGIMKNPFGMSAEAIGAQMIAKIRNSWSAVMDIVEICASDEVKDREAYYLNEYRDNPFMLSIAGCQFKPVLQYKMDGSFVKKHVSITAAAKYNNTTLWRVQEVLNGSRKSHKEMVFIYESDYEDRRKGIVKDRHAVGLPKKNKNSKVVQYDLSGNQVAEYATYAAAGRAVGCDDVNIKRAVARRQHTAGGFRWELVNA